MKTRAPALGLAAAVLLAAGGCNKSNTRTANGSLDPQTKTAHKLAGTQTIAVGISPTSRFMVAAKTAGLDQTLAGPGPYTVFVPDDGAFKNTSSGTFDNTPDNRARITGVLTNLILPGTVMVADIDKAIENGKGKTSLATVGGGTLTATKDNGRTVLTDSAGDKATITQGDEQYTNGVVHHVDGLLMPARAAAGPAVGRRVRH